VSIPILPISSPEAIAGAEYTATAVRPGEYSKSSSSLGRYCTIAGLTSGSAYDVTGTVKSGATIRAPSAKISETSL